MSVDTFVKRGLLVFPVALTFLAMGAIGCSSDKSTNPPVELTVNDDVAQSIASDMGADDGGAMDQIGDMVQIAGPVGPSGVQSLTDVVVPPVTATYNDTTGVWTIQISRIRGSETGSYYADVERTYHFKYLDKNAQPQKFWVVGSDTAYTATLDIVSGSGRHHTPTLSQELTGLAGSWTATGVNTDTLTVNGTYSRSARDTIRTLLAVRTLDHTLQMNFINVKGPRGSRLNLDQKVSGTITGTYSADITFQSGTAYSERHVDRSFTITLHNGTATIIISGQSYAGNVRTGVLGG